MMLEEDAVAMLENVKFELAGRFDAIQVGKKHLSVRYEPEGNIVRVGACIERYDWDNRDAVLDLLLDFEDSHRADFSVEFDIVPLEAVTDPQHDVA